MANSIDRQNATISGFSRVLNAEAARVRSGEANFIESIMEKSAEKKENWQKKQAAKATAPRISHYRPENPLNGIYMLNSDEQKVLRRQLKQNEK